MSHTFLQSSLSRHLGHTLALGLMSLPLAFGQPPGSGSNSDRSPQIATSTENRFTRANELRKAEENQDALAVINEAIWFDPACGKCFGLRSGIKGNLDLYKEGIADGHQGMLLSKRPHDKAMSAYNKGYNLGALGRNSEALEAYEDSIRFDPTFAMAHFGKGKVLNALQMWSASQKALEEALRLNPKHGPSWAYLAEDQNFLGEADAGLESATNAIEFAPMDPRSFLARAFANAGLHNFEATLADAARTLELDPRRPLAHLLRAYAFRGLDRDDEAEKELALEPDRKAVRYGFPYQVPDTRIYNCGDDSTEIETPANFKAEGFEKCKERIVRSLEESALPASTPSPAKRPIPGIPAKKKPLQK